jgi:hypothetical protein
LWSKGVYSRFKKKIHFYSYDSVFSPFFQPENLTKVRTAAVATYVTCFRSYAMLQISRSNLLRWVHTVTLPRTVTTYRDTVYGTRDHVTYQNLVTR